MQNKQQNKHHVHADLIIAWANGAEIQYYDDGTWVDIETPSWKHQGQWFDCNNPTWDENAKYRIKPEQKSAGQVYCEVYNRGWDSLSQQGKDNYEHNAQRVIQAFKENNLV
jgi:hypothetical protein